MPNTKDLGEDTQLRFLLCGYPGSGKTTQALTLPGRKFAYVFDPNALQALRGADIDYEIFLPDAQDVDLSAKTLKSGVGDKPRRRKEPVTYMNWEKDFDDRYDSGYFDNYDWVIFDSFTNFLDIIMDRLLYLNGRMGKQPEQADWAAQVNTCSNVRRVLAALDLGILATAHLDLKQNDVSKKIFHHIYITGKLRIRIPQLFNNVWVCHADSDEKGRFYQFQTAPDKEYPVVRSQWNTAPFEDATIQDFNRPEDFGLGALMKRFGYSGLSSRRTVGELRPVATSTKGK
jgi:hypothetical protein